MWPFKTKDNPAQPDIADDQGIEHYSTRKIVSVRAAYDQLEVVNRGVNLIVDSAADISIDTKDRRHGLAVNSTDIRPKKLDFLLNFKPNPYIDANVFKRNVIMDILIDGNAFIYFDGQYIYNLPAAEVTIISDKKTFVNSYVYGDVSFTVAEVIHIRENSSKSIYRGDSRILSALGSINALASLVNYQQKFLDNGTIPGIVLTSENPMSDRVKQRVRSEWTQQYRLKDNAKNPILLDANWRMQFLGASTIQELDFESSVLTLENKILEAIGVPQVLLRSGNNANVAPNVRMYYHLTVIPIVNKMVYGLERFFGYDLKIRETEILPMRPDLREEGAFWTSMVNAGIFTRNEARENFRYEEVNDSDIADELILPANIAGSAADANVGGRPANDGND